MQVRPEQLAQHVQQLKPIYILAGDEPLLVQESSDLIRNAAVKQGYTQREVFHVDTSFDWNHLLAEASEMSLFASKKVLDVRIPSGKPGAEGSKALLECLALMSGQDNNLLLITLPKLDRTAQKAKWFTALEKAGCYIPIWPIKPEQLANWVKARLSNAQIHAEPDAIQLLCDRVEGNLLAANQEIQKLALLAPDHPLNVEEMQQLTSNHARYDLYAFIDDVLAGKAQRLPKVFYGLMAENTEPLRILWVLNKELKTLYRAKTLTNKGQQADWALKQSGVWDSKIALYRGALNRTPLQRLSQLLLLCSQIDRAFKGMRTGNPIDELFFACMSLANSPIHSKNSTLLTITL